MPENIAINESYILYDITSTLKIITISNFENSVMLNVISMLKLKLYFNNII